MRRPYFQPEAIQAVTKNDSDDKTSQKRPVKVAQSGAPPIPPGHVHGSSLRSIADASSIRIEHLTRGNSSKGSLTSLHGDRDREGLVSTADDELFGGSGAPEGDDEEERVMHINLSSAVLNPHSLPESVKLQSNGM